MPRWKALPEDLDPQIKEFTSQLRRLVERSGLSSAALADRTGYSKTSWERYLGGRLLAPKGAVVALAEVTGASPVHLTTMWELAERAWSRAEMRHDRTMEAIRISQARAALGEFGAAEATGSPGGGSPSRKSATPGIAGPAGVSPTLPSHPTTPDTDTARATGGPVDAVPGAGGRGSAGSGVTDGVAGSSPGGGDSWGRSGPGAAGGPVDAVPGAGGRGSADVTEGIAGSPGGRDSRGRAGSGAVGPTDAVPGAGSGAGGPAGSGVVGGAAGSSPGGGTAGAGTTGSDSGGNSWGLAGYQGPSPASGRPGARAADRPDGGTRGPDTPSPYTGHPAAPQPGPVTRGGGNRQRLTMFLAGLVGVLVIIAGVFFFTRQSDGTKHGTAAKPPAPTASSNPSPPPGVKCAGSACTGKDAEAMGCSGDLVTTARTTTLGTTTLEVRYSRTCGAAWGRITGGAPGDTVRVTVGGTSRTGNITAAGDTIAYTPMIAVKDAAEARACATLASGRTGCTR